MISKNIGYTFTFAVVEANASTIRHDTSAPLAKGAEQIEQEKAVGIRGNRFILGEKADKFLDFSIFGSHQLISQVYDAEKTREDTGVCDYFF